MSQTGTSRRQFLKIVAAAAGTAVLSSVPNKWETPVVDVGMLPAHAQGLSGNGAIAGTITVVLTGAKPTGTNSPAAPSVTVGTISPIVIPGVLGTVTTNGTHRFAPYVINTVPAGTYTVRANASICIPSYIDVASVGVTAGLTTSGINFNFSDCGA